MTQPRVIYVIKRVEDEEGFYKIRTTNKMVDTFDTVTVLGVIDVRLVFPNPLFSAICFTEIIFGADPTF